MSDVMIQRARELRRSQTPHEQELWRELRAKRFSGFKFRRQAPIGRYIVDFTCFSMKVIVELDGSQHQDNQDYDAARDQWLTEQGFTVLRFWNNQWAEQREAVLEMVWRALRHPLPNPSPIKGEGLKPEPAGLSSISTAYDPKSPIEGDGLKPEPVGSSSTSTENDPKSPIEGDGLTPEPAGSSSTSTAHDSISPLSPRGRGAGGEGAGA